MIGTLERRNTIFEPRYCRIPETLVHSALTFEVDASCGHLLVGQSAVMNRWQGRSGREVDRNGVYALFRKSGPACVDCKCVYGCHCSP